MGLFGFGPTDFDAGLVLPVYGDVRCPAAVRPAEVGDGNGVGAVIAVGSVNEQVVVPGLASDFYFQAGVVSRSATSAQRFWSGLGHAGGPLVGSGSV